MPDEERPMERLAPLPTKGGGTNTPLPEVGADAGSPPVDATTASSAEEGTQEQPSEQAPPPSSQPAPETYHVPPKERWDELIRERNEFKQLAELAMQKIQPPTPTPPAEDPWKGLVDHHDPATAQFYQQQRALFQKEAERMADQKLQGILQAVDLGRRELASMKISQFRKDNPDIKPGSQEEALVASYVQQGYDLESSKKLALFEKLEAENRALKGKQAAITKKAAANVESSAGIPETSGLPGRPADWRQRASEVIDKGGEFLDVANAIFGRKRKA